MLAFRKATLKGNGGDIDRVEVPGRRLTIDNHTVNKLAALLALTVSVYCLVISKLSPEMKVFSVLDV